MFNVLSRLISIEISPPPWARKFFLVGAQIISLKSTMQRYNITIAVHECRGGKKCRGRDGQSHFGQNRKPTVKIRHYNINILFIYSEQ